VRLADRIRGRSRSTLRRLLFAAASRVDLEIYEPSGEHRSRLEALAAYTEDDRPIRDTRSLMLTEDDRDLTITTEGLVDMLDLPALRGGRVLEVGPKHGLHSLWLDRALEPSELVFLDLPSERELHDRWRAKLRSPHRFVYADVRQADELLHLERFDLVLCLGVLYHTVYHIPMLAVLNRATELGGRLLIETTFDPRSDSSVRLRWQASTAKAKAVPTIDATRLMLAWTGWRQVTRFTEYRPGSSEVVFLCVKTDELVEGTDFAPVVTPHRVLPGGEAPAPATLRPVPGPAGVRVRERAGRASARVLAAATAAAALLALLFAALPEALGDRPYNVF
jgi:Methyltransferase domain